MRVEENAEMVPGSDFVRREQSCVPGIPSHRVSTGADIACLRNPPMVLPGAAYFRANFNVTM